MTENTSDKGAIRLEVGQEAPSFTIETTEGEVTLAQLVEAAEKGVIVYFYPKAMTPGCTKEACDFRDNLNSLKGAGYSVIGISADKMTSLQKFKDKDSLNFPLGTDPDHSIMKQWGTYGSKMNYGKVFQGIIRSTFVVGKDGKIEVAQYNVKATGHVARLRKTLGLDD